jgi:hypothetical protein
VHSTLYGFVATAGFNWRPGAGDALDPTADPWRRDPLLLFDASDPARRCRWTAFYIGRRQGTKDTVWQYSACDVASGFAYWA